MNLKSIFYLHRSDRKVLLLLLLFIVGSIGLIIFVGNQTTETSVVKNDSISKLKPTSFSRKEQLPTVEMAEGKYLFPFDPNTATAEELQQLGLARDSRYLVGIGIYFGKPKKKETFIYNSS